MCDECVDIARGSAVERERERIIKLLNKGFEDNNLDWANCICLSHFEDLIALIKGENK